MLLRVFDKYYALSQTGPIQTCAASPVMCPRANQFDFTVYWLQSRVGAEKNKAKTMGIWAILYAHSANGVPYFLIKYPNVIKQEGCSSSKIATIKLHCTAVLKIRSIFIMQGSSHVAPPN